MPSPDPAFALSSTRVHGDFACDVLRSPRDAEWLRLRGELDSAITPLLAAHLDDALSRARLVVVDLRDLTRIDGAALPVIVAAADRARCSERRLAIVRGGAEGGLEAELVSLAERCEVIDSAGMQAALPPLESPGAPASPAKADRRAAGDRRGVGPAAASSANGPGRLPRSRRSAAGMRAPADLAAQRLHRLSDGELWSRRDGCGVREELVRRFLPLARRLAFRYRNVNEPVEDLVQVATVGLLGAIDRFDPGHGPSFTSFAIPTILGELKRHFRNTGWAAHVPRGAQEMAMRVDRAARELTTQTGSAPRVAALAEHLHVSLEDVLLGLDAGTAHYSTSLDAPVPGADLEESATLAESIGAEDDRIGLTETALSLVAAIPQLPYLERQALTMRMVQNLRQVDIARQMGCSQMQVSRLLRRATASLRAATNPELTPTG